MPDLDKNELREALLAYAASYDCPGFLVGYADDTSGCDGTRDDCPTCAAVINASKEQR